MAMKEDEKEENLAPAEGLPSAFIVKGNPSSTAKAIMNLREEILFSLNPKQMYSTEEIKKIVSDKAWKELSRHVNLASVPQP